MSAPARQRPFLWELPVCTCHYFYQFYLCGCPDRTASVGTQQARHVPSFKGCPLYYVPLREKIEQYRAGFRHNTAPPLVDTFRVLPFPCYRHTEEARIYYPPQALRHLRRRLINPKWNPFSAMRKNYNSHMLQRFQAEHSCGQSRKRAREEDAELCRQQLARQRQRNAIEEERLRDARRRLSAMGASSVEQDKARLTLYWMAGGRPPPLPPKPQPDRPDRSRYPDEVSSVVRFGISVPPSPYPTPRRRTSPSASSTEYTSQSESDTSHPSGNPSTEPTSPPQSPEPDDSTVRLSAGGSRSRSSTRSATVARPAPGSRSSSTTSPFTPPTSPTYDDDDDGLEPTYTCTCPRLHHTDPPCASSLRNHFGPPDTSSLDWLLEEQNVDLARQDGCTARDPYLPGHQRQRQRQQLSGSHYNSISNSRSRITKPAYEAHTNTGYDGGAYAYDLRVLFQARAANWWAADPTGRVAWQVGEFFAGGAAQGDQAGGWGYGWLLSME